jgi:hypothetical protein
VSTREIDERIADVLEQVVNYWNANPVEVVAAITHVAAELRAAKHAHPTTECHALGCASPAPPPSLVERARNRIEWGRDPAGDELLSELADALEAAQAVVAALKASPWSQGGLIDACETLAASMERKPK